MITRHSQMHPRCGEIVTGIDAMSVRSRAIIGRNGKMNLLDGQMNLAVR